MKEVARVLYGSQNYGLSGADSDKDYKVLFCPSYSDLYDFTKVSTSDLPAFYDKEHVSPVDCRQFDNLVLKCNPNTLEMLFSTEWVFQENVVEEYVERAKDLLKSGYLRLKYKEFYLATKGLVFNSLDGYGVNAKSISRAYYFQQMLFDLVEENFYMDENTWRNKPYVEQAYKLRFEATENELQTVRDKVVLLLNSEEEKCCEKAKQLMVKAPDYTKYLKNMVTDLHNYMKNVVKSLLLKEFI